MRRTVKKWRTKNLKGKIIFFDLSGGFEQEMIQKDAALPKIN